MLQTSPPQPPMCAKPRTWGIALATLGVALGLSPSAPNKCGAQLIAAVQAQPQYGYPDIESARAAAQESKRPLLVVFR